LQGCEIERRQVNSARSPRRRRLEKLEHCHPEICSATNRRVYTIQEFIAECGLILFKESCKVKASLRNGSEDESGCELHAISVSDATRLIQDAIAVRTDAPATQTMNISVPGKTIFPDPNAR